MKTHTFDDICESQDFDHDQEFVEKEDIEKEILNKVHMRRGLVELLLEKRIDREQLDELHTLDKELLGKDVIGIMFDELLNQGQEISELKEIITDLNKACEFLIKGEPQDYSDFECTFCDMGFAGYSELGLKTHDNKCPVRVALETLFKHKDKLKEICG